MKIVEPYAKILPGQVESREDGTKMLRQIEYIARVSHRSEERMGGDSWERFIQAVVMQHGDWSVVEHRSVTVEAVVDRGISHEWVRHRIGAYTQESTRFCNYGKDEEGIAVIQPPGVNDGLYAFWLSGVIQSERHYLALLQRGIAPQVARALLPTCLATKLIVTYNLRNWRHFFLMRTSKEAHPQMRQVAIPLLKEFQEKIPLLYDDIIPEQRQVDNLRLPR